MVQTPKITMKLPTTRERADRLISMINAHIAPEMWSGQRRSNGHKVVIPLCDDALASCLRQLYTDRGWYVQAMRDGVAPHPIEYYLLFFYTRPKHS